MDKNVSISNKCPFFLTVDSCWLKEWKVKEESVFLCWWHLLPENIFSHWALIPGCSDLSALLHHPFIYFYALMETSVLVEATEAFSSLTSEHFVPTIFSGVNGALLVWATLVFLQNKQSVCSFFSGELRNVSVTFQNFHISQEGFSSSFTPKTSSWWWREAFCAQRRNVCSLSVHICLHDGVWQYFA